MPAIDLTAPRVEPLHLLDGLPRRIGLNLAELRACARAAGDAPLPLAEETGEGPTRSAIASRLGGGGSGQDPASHHREALEALGDPVLSLRHRGLLVDDVLDGGIAGAIGLLAAPDVAVDIDLAVGSRGGQRRLRAWHRFANGAVAGLATADGLMFEITWAAASQWPTEVNRVARVAAGDPGADDQGISDAHSPGAELPDRLQLPHELIAAAEEARRHRRTDLSDRLIDQHLPDTPATSADQLARWVTALLDGADGRLRVLVGKVGARGPAPRPDPGTVGVVSWLHSGGSWYALGTHTDRSGSDRAMLRIERVAPEDLAGHIAPVLSTAGVRRDEP